MKLMVMAVAMIGLFSLAPGAHAQDWHSNDKAIACPEYTQLRTLTELAVANDMKGFQQHSDRYSCLWVPAGKKVHILEERDRMFAKVRVDGWPMMLWINKNGLTNWGSQR